MSETNSQPSESLKPASLPHVVAGGYADLHPTGYLLFAMNPLVRLVYYHDEFRVIAEHTLPDGTVSFPGAPVRVQDVGVTMPMDDFVRLTVGNLKTIFAERPELAEKYKVTLGD